MARMLLKTMAIGFDAVCGVPHCHCMMQTRDKTAYRACIQESVHHARVAVCGCHMQSCRASTVIVKHAA